MEEREREPERRTKNDERRTKNAERRTDQMSKLSTLTPFQTVGPFFDFGLIIPGGETIAQPSTAGRHIAVEGMVRDGAGDPVPDALVEIWQADAAGKYRHPAADPPSAGQGAGTDRSFDGFGRIPTGDDGRFAFTTVKPGRVPGPGRALQAPHLVVGVLARGVLTRLITRMYFEDDPANGEDPVLALVPEGRRATLIARLDGPDRYRFDIVLQGQGETVLFDV
jgi:protocatechuate 3,4-dioxygenase alpha subunit